MIKHWAAVLGTAALAACATAPSRPATSDAYADFLIGRTANLRQDHAAAADRYFAALERGPRDAAMLDGAVVAALASGDVARARRAASMAARVGGPAYAHLVRASDALSGRRFNDASRELNQLEGTASQELLARMTMVWARAGQGRIDEVLADLAPLAQIRPYGALFAYQQAMALDYSGRSEEALAAYDLASRGGLWLPNAVEHYADLLVRLGRRDDAVALLSTQTNANNPGLQAALTRVHAGEPAALERLTPARGAAISLYGMSAIYLEEFDTTNGLAALTLALMLDPDFDGARLAFAQQQARLGHIELARGALNQVSSESAYAASARALDALVVFQSGYRDAALELARANAAGGDPRALRSLAEMYRGMDRYADAEAAFTDLIEREPTDWRLHFSRGAARERLGRHQDAEADFQRALAIFPDQPDVMNYLGYMWVDRGERLQEGLALIERAVALRPNSGAIIDSLGWAYYRVGNYERALEQIERAIELEPADPTLNDHLGDVYWRLGRGTEARFQWRRALGLNPENPAAIQAKLDNGLTE